MQTFVLSRPDRIGDQVITSCVIEPIRRRFPNARIYWLGTQVVRPLLEGVRELTGYVELPEDEGALVGEFGRIKPDVIVHFEPHEVVYRAAAQANIVTRIGWGHAEWEKWLTLPVADMRKQGKKHEGAYAFELLRTLDVAEPGVLRPVIAPRIGAMTSLRPKLPWDLTQTRYIVLNPTSARDVRQWPLDRWVMLARWIYEKLKLPVVTLGASAKHPVLRGFQSYTRELPIVRMEGALDLAEVGYLLKHAALLVSCDTGPTHIAATMDRPQVVLFGRTEAPYGPTRWRPMSPAATVVEADIRKRLFEPTRSFWKRGFESITVEMVRGEISRKISGIKS
jgi:heptosyltransferase-2